MEKSNSRTFKTFGDLCEPCSRHFNGYGLRRSVTDESRDLESTAIITDCGLLFHILLLENLACNASITVIFQLGVLTCQRATGWLGKTYKTPSTCLQPPTNPTDPAMKIERHGVFCWPRTVVLIFASVHLF